MQNNNFNPNFNNVPPQYGANPQPQGTYAPQRPPYAPKLKKPPIAGDGFDAVFMIISLVFAVFAVHSVLFSGFFKLGFTVAYALWFILENIYIFSKNKPKLSFYPIVLALLSLGASGVFSLYNDETINFALLLFIGFANAEYFLLLSKQNLFPAGEISAVLDAARYILIIPFKYIAEPFRSAFSVNRPEKKKGNGAKTVQILIGLAISIPIAAVLIALLANADAAFKGLIGKIFSNLLLTLAKLILGIIAFPLLLSPAFALRYSLPMSEQKIVVKRDTKRFPSAISVTILSVISLVYLVYLFAQLAYFFSAFKGILPEDYSASEYARKGFFEMCAICAINALIIALSMAFAKRDSKGSEVLHKLFQIFISLVSLVIAASSFSKMYLYIELYGLTRKRILTSVFILMLSVVFISLIFRILFEKFPYMKVIAVCCFAILIAVGYMDIDSNIAKYNYNLYKNNYKIAVHLQKDSGFIDELGDSASPYIARFAEEGKGDVKLRAQSWMCELWGRENVKDYFSVNLSKPETPLSYNKARKESTLLADNFNEKYSFDKFWKRYFDDDYDSSVKGLPDYCYDYSYVKFSD